MSDTRDYAAELSAVRAAQDWAACERIWEERRIAEVEADEALIASDGAEDDAHKAAHEVYDAVFARYIKAGADYSEAQEAAQYASEIELDRHIDADWHRA